MIITIDDNSESGTPRKMWANVNRINSVFELDGKALIVFADGQSYKTNQEYEMVTNYLEDKFNSDIFNESRALNE